MTYRLKMWENPSLLSGAGQTKYPPTTLSEKYRSSVGSCNRQFSSLYSNRIREFTRVLLIPHLNESVAPATVHSSMQDCATIRGPGFHLKIWIPYVISKWSSAQGQPFNLSEYYSLSSRAGSVCVVSVSMRERPDARQQWRVQCNQRDGDDG